jgi:hypothetical protein
MKYNHKQNNQIELEKSKEERQQQIEPIADLIATEAGRELRAKEIRLLESFETKNLNTSLQCLMMRLMAMNLNISYNNVIKS